MLRAARFIARFELVPDAALVNAVHAMHDRLEIVSAERIRDELDKLVVVKRATPGLSFIVETGLASEFLPELPALALEQDPIHRHKDVLAHTFAVVDKRTRRTACCGSRACSTTWASRRPARSGLRGSPSTTTRWSAPEWCGTA